MATKTFKIGLSNTDKQNMAQDVYERLLALTFSEYNSSNTYNKGDFVVYNDALYQCLADNVTGTWDATKWQSATLQDLLDDVEDAVASVNGKANTIDLLNGTLVVAKSLSAKSIENISEDSGSTQDDPFIAQGTGTNNNTSEVSTSPVAKQLEKQGNTIVRNQYAKELNATNWTATSQGATISFSDGIAKFTATARYGGITQTLAVKIPANKTVRLFVLLKTTTPTNQIQCLTQYSSGSSLSKYSVASTNYQIVEVIDTPTNESAYVTIRDNRESDWDEVEVKVVELNNLDQWFNGNIPEVFDRTSDKYNPSAWLNYDCTDDSYNTGTIKNADGVTLVTIKKNQWNNNVKVNYYWDTTGSQAGSANYDCSNEKIRVLPNKTYIFAKGSDSTYSSTLFYLRFFDKDGNVINSGDSIGTAYQFGNTINIPSNCVEIGINSAYQVRFGNSPQIALYLVYWKDNDDHSQGMDGDHYNTYIPFEKHEYNTGTETLRSAGSVKDYKEPNGTIHRLVGSYTFTGSESWTFNSTNNYFESPNISDAGKTATTTNVVSDSGLVIAGFYYQSSGNGRLRVYLSENPQLTSESNLNNYFTSGKQVFFEKATPTTEQGTSFPENIEVDDYGMMYWLDEDGNIVTTPQGCKFFYPADYVLLIDDLNNYTNGDVTSLAKKSDIPTALNAYLTSLAGYDATKTQTLKNVNGVFTWVDDE